MSDAHKTKVCIIGAGWYGIVTAKTYLEVQSDIDLTILEAEDSIGGIWSRRRAHPTLLTQQPYGSYEYADMTLDTAGVTDPKNSYIPSETLHSYMEDYAQRFGIMDKVRFNTKVKKIERASPPELGWRIWSQNSSESEGPLIFDKVVVATGMSSNPSIPQISTANFAPPVFHTMELGDRRDWISSDQVKNITIYGGGKSAVDAMYMSVKNGKQVDWVIRPDSIGNGVPPLFSAYFRGRATNETISTRLMSKLFPSLDSLDDWWYRFFHSGTSRLGAWLHWKFFGMFNDMLVKLMGYDKNENMKKLKPVVLDHAVFWANLPGAIITQQETYEIIRSGKNIKIHRQEITSLSDDKVQLSNGENLKTDAVVLATGYNVIEEVYSPELAAELGVPVQKYEYPAKLKEKWDALETKADAEVIRLFPLLASPPEPNHKPVAHTPYRLYNRALPPSMVEKEDRSLVFVGAVQTYSTAIHSEVQTLWSVAWLTGTLSLKSVKQEDIEMDIAMNIAFGRRRYTGACTHGQYALFESFPMVDALMRQLGLNPKRKNGRWNELFGVYQPDDYRGIVQEYKDLRGLGVGGPSV